jgi:hypothetical protein
VEIHRKQCKLLLISNYREQEEVEEDGENVTQISTDDNDEEEDVSCVATRYAANLKMIVCYADPLRIKPIQGDAPFCTSLKLLSLFL